MKKGEILEGIIQEVEFPNKGRVLTDEGEVTVKNGIPGQRVRFVINKKRRNQAEGRLLEVLENSPLEKRDPLCSIFPACGGCMYQTMLYEDQLRMKETQVKKLLDAAMVTAGQVDENGQPDYCFEGIKGSPKEFAYRNKMEFSFGDEYKDGPLSLGLHKKGSTYDVLTAADCKIVHQDMTEILRCVLDYFRGLDAPQDSHDLSAQQETVKDESLNEPQETAWGEALHDPQETVGDVPLHGRQETAKNEALQGVQESTGDELLYGAQEIVKNEALHGLEDVKSVSLHAPQEIAKGEPVHDREETMWDESSHDPQKSAEDVPLHYHKMSHKGFLRHLLLRRAETTGEILVNLVTTSQREYDLTPLVNQILSLELEGKIVGILHMINDSVADVVRSDETRILYGVDYFYETVLGLRFRITPFSFFQTNSLGAEVLYSTARDYVGDTRDMTVFDLYSGTGTIAQILASVAKEVIGVEIVEEAVEAARENARQNGLSNCRFIAGDVLKVIDELPEKPDIIVLDPPRDGIHPKALPKIAAHIQAKKLIYISCKPTSLARDLVELEKYGYRVERACCVDMFPETAHTETICELTKKK